jgi:hypothetical protein
MNTTLNNLEQIKRAYNLLLAWAENDEAAAEETTCRDRVKDLRNQADNYRALAEAIKPATLPVFIRAYVEGGVLQGISTDQPEQIQVFIWDRDETGEDHSSVWEDSPFEITPEEVERTRHEAAYQQWQWLNTEEGPDHRGAEDRINGVQPLPEIDGFKARPATHDENGDPLPAPDYSDKPAPCPSIFEKNADLYSDNVNGIQPIE